MSSTRSLSFPRRRKSSKYKLIVIVGPTASGKSNLAVALAKKYNGEVISADSRQVYRGLDLASGKVARDRFAVIPALGRNPARLRKLDSRLRGNDRSGKLLHQGIPHHLLNVTPLRRVFTVADYKRLCENAIRDIIRRGKLPIIAGGTGLYIDAVLYNQQIPEVKPDPGLRKKLEVQSAAALFSRLRKLDPVRAASIDRRNKRRLVRALEIVLSTDRPIPRANPKKHSGILQNMRISSGDVLKIGLYPGPEKIKQNIRARILARLRQGPASYGAGQGMVAEIRKLHESGISWKRLEDLGLEARWIARYLRELGRPLSSRASARDLKDRMIAGLEKDTWAYARRQMTWWRKDKEIRWVNNQQEAVRLLPSARTK